MYLCFALNKFVSGEFKTVKSFFFCIGEFNQKCVASSWQADWLEVADVVALHTLKHTSGIFQIIVGFSVPSPMLVEMDLTF